jgi:hypothetical protein
MARLKKRTQQCRRIGNLKKTKDYGVLDIDFRNVTLRSSNAQNTQHLNDSGIANVTIHLNVTNGEMSSQQVYGCLVCVCQCQNRPAFDEQTTQQRSNIETLPQESTFDDRIVET